MLAKSFPGYSALASPEPASLKDVQTALHEDEALVLFLDTGEFNPLPEETFVWVVSKTDMRWVRSELGTSALNRDVAALRCGLDASAWRSEGAKWCNEALNRQHEDGVPSPLPFDTERAHKLYTALFGTIEDLIRNKNLLIVPSGALTTLPFQVLVTKPPASSTAVRWLVQDHAVTVLPAASSLKALRGPGGNEARTADRSMIGIGNPTLDGVPKDEIDRLRAAAAKYRQDCVLSHSAEEEILIAAGQFHAERRTTLGATVATPAAVMKLDPVPGTAHLLCDLAKHPSFEGSPVLLGRSASKRAVKALSTSGELARYRVVHFATHGLLPRSTANGLEPGLVLTPTEGDTEDDNGYLSASDIAGLKLDADAVILSACNTAAAGELGGDALSGLARAFIYAQSRALVVSHWQVYEQAAVELIAEMLKQAARPGIGLAVAQQRAILELIGDGSAQRSHPAYWAPFVVVGEGAAAR